MYLWCKYSANPVKKQSFCVQLEDMICRINRVYFVCIFAALESLMRLFAGPIDRIGDLLLL